MGWFTTRGKTSYKEESLFRKGLETPMGYTVEYFAGGPVETIISIIDQDGVELYKGDIVHKSEGAPYTLVDWDSNLAYLREDKDSESCSISLKWYGGRYKKLEGWYRMLHDLTGREPVVGDVIYYPQNPEKRYKILEFESYGVKTIELFGEKKEGTHGIVCGRRQEWVIETNQEKKFSKSPTGALKEEKIERFDLIPAKPLTELARLYGEGAKKYGDRNWEKGNSFGKHYTAAQRHMNKFWSGEDLDNETQVFHLIAAAWNCFAITEYYLKDRNDLDDRPTKI